MAMMIESVGDNDGLTPRTEGAGVATEIIANGRNVLCKLEAAIRWGEGVMSPAANSLECSSNSFD